MIYRLSNKHLIPAVAEFEVGTRTEATPSSPIPHREIDVPSDILVQNP